MSGPVSEQEKRELQARLEALLITRQTLIGGLRTWLTDRVATKVARGETPYPHDVEFLTTTQPIVDWFDGEIAAIQQQIEALP